MTDGLGVPIAFEPTPRRRSRTAMAAVILILVAIPVLLLPAIVLTDRHGAPPPVLTPRPQQR